MGNMLRLASDWFIPDGGIAMNALSRCVGFPFLICLLVGSAAIAAETDYFTSPLESIAEGFKFTEGPVWHKDGYLLFSDIPANHIYRSDGISTKEVWREDSGQSNGLAFDREGRLIACEHGNRRVSRTEADGTITAIADRHDGKALNSPNDCAVRSDGMVFFTDPSYGVGNREKELAFCGVYRVMPGSEPVLLVDDFKMPNGLAFSPDESTLYVGDAAGGQIRVFDVEPDGTLKNGKVFVEVQGPDGMKVDVNGNLVTTSVNGMVVYDPTGKQIAILEMDIKPTNCAFGGEDNQTLFITARPNLFKVRVSVPGVKVQP